MISLDGLTTNSTFEHVNKYIYKLTLLITTYICRMKMNKPRLLSTRCTIKEQANGMRLKLKRSTHHRCQHVNKSALLKKKIHIIYSTKSNLLKMIL